MKKLIILAIVAMGFTSCEKCYQCTYRQVTSPQVSQPVISTSEFCGTEKEKDAFEKAGSSKATSGGVTVTTTMTCGI